MLRKCGSIGQTSSSPVQRIFFTLYFFLAIVSSVSSFISAGLFYGTISSLFRFFISNQSYDVNSVTQDNAFSMASWFENTIFLCYIILVLVSIGMGKGLNNNRIKLTLKMITAILCGFNFFVMIYGFSKLFTSTLSVLVIGTFLLTFLMPALLYDFKGTTNLKQFIPGVLSYLVCIPLYLIVF